MKQSWFIQIEKTLFKLNKRQRENTQIDKNQKERDITTDTKEIQETIKGHMFKMHIPSN